MTSSKTPSLIGIPYEEGMYWRKGAKEGPAAIRKQLAKRGNFSLLFDKEIKWDIIGMDVVEVAPLYDYSDITSLLAAHIIFEMLVGARWC
jgi:arginase family enzyme